MKNFSLKISHRIFIFTFIILVMLAFGSCTRKMKFNKEQWSSRVDVRNGVRIAMLPDLLENYRLQGMTYSDLTDLLGEPDFNNPSKSDSMRVGYQIKSDPGAGFGMRPQYVKNLIFYFDADSVVSRYKVTVLSP